MKKFLKSKTSWAVVLALLVGFGGTFLYMSKTNQSKPSEEKTDQLKNTGDETQSSNGKNDDGQTTSPQTTPAPTPPPVQDKPPVTSTPALAALATTVTAQKNVSDSSIDVIFYLQGSGTFTSQQKSGANWVTVKENQNYPGRGGFTAGTLPAGQDTITMRVLKIENGKYTAVTKEFTISRAEVEQALGIKTYN